MIGTPIKSNNFMNVAVTSEEIDKFIEKLNFELDLDEVELDDKNNYLCTTEKEIKDVSFIYVVTNPVYKEKNMFKIGKHTGTRKMLWKRYKTYLIDVEILFFFPTGTPTEDENYLLSMFSRYRQNNSEFLQISSDKLMTDIYRFYRNKYERKTSVKMLYHYGYWNSKVFDFLDKRYDNQNCKFLTNMIGGIDVVSKNNKIYELNSWVHYFCEEESDIENGKEEMIIEFLKCFMVEFSNYSKILFLDQFIPGGWNDLLIEIMKNLYGFHQFKILTRKEFIQKEKITERILFIKFSPVHLDLVLEKAQATNCCLVIEDKNGYSIHNRDLTKYDFKDFIYYLFYCL
jgi:hypothetical protein